MGKKTSRREFLKKAGTFGLMGAVLGGSGLDLLSEAVARRLTKHGVHHHTHECHGGYTQEPCGLLSTYLCESPHYCQPNTTVKCMGPGSFECYLGQGENPPAYGCTIRVFHCMCDPNKFWCSSFDCRSTEERDYFQCDVNFECHNGSNPYWEI